jgi:putative nucleotidyltransferase with HDIG domain
MEDQLNAFLDRIEHLPPSPRLLVKLMEMFKQPDKDIGEVVNLISHDPAFTVEVLKRCNSAYFGAGKPAEDMSEAVMRLGFEEIYSLIVAMFAASAILRPGHTAHVEILWRHSVAVAVASRVLAHAVGESTLAGFTAGLLHEVGKVIMVSADEAGYANVLLDAAMLKRPVIVVEKEVFGFNHAEAGACLLARWNLPPNIVAAVAHHHHLAGAEPFQRLAATVHLANLVAHGTSERFTGVPKGLENAADSMGLLGLTAENLVSLLPAMLEGLQKARAFAPS